MGDGARTAVLLVVLLFLGVLAFLTIDVMVNNGIDVLVVLALLVIALFAFGVVGALTDRSRD